MKGDNAARLHEALSVGGANGNKSTRETPVPDGVLTITPDVPEASDWRTRKSPMDVQCSSESVLYDDDEGPEPSELYGKFTWKIENFSDISKRELRSDVFEVGKYKWYILVYPQGCDVANHLSLFLCVADYDKLLPGWSHFAQFTIAVVNKDPKKSKYSDTLHRFCKKEHDWGWKKFMELSKVLDGFTVADTLVIRAQVQVIRDRPARPFRCLDPQYRRELVRVYLTNVEGICRRFLDEAREQLSMVRSHADSIRAFWDSLNPQRRETLACEKIDVVFKGLVKKFFSEKEVTSTLVMDALHAGCQAVEDASSLHLASAGDPGDGCPIVVIDAAAGCFRVGFDDTLDAVATVLTEQLPPYRDDEQGDEYGGRSSKDTVDQDESRLVELGRQAVEVFVLAHVWTNNMEVAYREAEALRLQEDLLREEEARRAESEEKQAAKSAAQAEKRKAKKERKKKLKEEEKRREDEERLRREEEERAKREEEERRKREVEDKRRAEEEERRRREEEEAAKKAEERRKKEEERRRREEEEARRKQEAETRARAEAEAREVAEAERRAAEARAREEEARAREQEVRAREEQRRGAEDRAAEATRAEAAAVELRAQLSAAQQAAAGHGQRAEDLAKAVAALEARVGERDKEVAQLRADVARLSQRPPVADASSQCDLQVPGAKDAGGVALAGPGSAPSSVAIAGARVDTSAPPPGMVPPGVPATMPMRTGALGLEPGVNPNATPFVPTVPAVMAAQGYPPVPLANGAPAVPFLPPGPSTSQQLPPSVPPGIVPGTLGGPAALATASVLGAAAAMGAHVGRGGSPTPSMQQPGKQAGAGGNKRNKPAGSSNGRNTGENRTRGAQASTSGPGQPGAGAARGPQQGAGVMSRNGGPPPGIASGAFPQPRGTQQPPGTAAGVQPKRGSGARGGAAARSPAPPPGVPHGVRAHTPGPGMAGVPALPVMPPGSVPVVSSQGVPSSVAASGAPFPVAQTMPMVRGMQPPPGMVAGTPGFPSTPHQGPPTSKQLAGERPRDSPGMGMDDFQHMGLINDLLDF